MSEILSSGPLGHKFGEKRGAHGPSFILFLSGLGPYSLGG